MASVQHPEGAVGAQLSLAEQVERLGVILEQTWYTPIQARIFAYLMVAQPAYQSFEDIQQFLGASKSSVSTGLKMLLQEQTVEYFTLPSDRRRYFRLTSAGVVQVVQKAMDDMQRIASALEMAADWRNTGGADPVVAQMRDWAGFYRRIPAAMAQMMQQGTP